jgi:hypothetical protein
MALNCAALHLLQIGSTHVPMVGSGPRFTVVKPAMLVARNDRGGMDDSAEHHASTHKSTRWLTMARKSWQRGAESGHEAPCPTVGTAAVKPYSGL